MIYLTLTEKSIFTLKNNIINKNTVIIIQAKMAKYNIFNVEVGRNYNKSCDLRMVFS